MKKYRLKRPVLVVLTAAVTAGVTLNLPAAEAETPAPAPQTVTVIDLYQQDTPPAYTAEMVVSWHEWQPTGKAAGVVPVALLELAEEYQISPVYAAAVFVLETGWGSSSAWLTKHNPAGIRCGDRYCQYSTATDGLRRMFEIMGDYYNNGLTTVAQQRSLWSEAEDTDLIVQLMEQLAGGN
ncbi:glucosaminidase domain-containing protein [Holdemania sp. 1001302B_160321_E10]|uniref:glucosaminidase domain-containing protein n=1 Tax=Holdemania sp. 1001302B_160321_E10 TaxID=2787120 RepID=UPI0018993302|nr:glucosaminidase domain-containing protein [Holdemania sp. 1001302B_160321_E10]